jgi:integral membrane protein
MKLDQRNLFRVVAIAEAVSWAGLLVGMYLKRVAETTEVGVVVFGPIHGVIVLAYLVAVFYGRRSFGWNARTALLAALASVPPFATVVFEVWADRQNLLRTVDSFSEEKVPAAN